MDITRKNLHNKNILKRFFSKKILLILPEIYSFRPPLILLRRTKKHLKSQHKNNLSTENRPDVVQKNGY